MPDTPKRYWLSVVERDTPEEVSRSLENGDPEFAPTRRSFLKAAGFTFGALAASSCRAPDVDAIPYVQQPDGLVPGRPLFYATTCGACEARCGLLVTTRDGRPIKIEGNPDHPFSGGSACAVGQASILGLYDSLRLQYPTKAGQRVAWADADKEILATLDRMKQEGRAVRVLTSTVTSPTTAAVIADFLSGFANGRHVSYDPISSAAILEAHAQTHGARLLPQYHFDQADVIVSFDADFLGAWISPLQHARGYASRRRASETSPTKSYHVQIESRLSLTGSNADRRLRVAPGEVGHVATHLAAKIAQRAGASFAAAGLTPSSFDAAIEAIAERLWNARTRGLVVSGSQDVQIQTVCNFINQTIGAYGVTVDLSRPSFQRSGSDTQLAELRAELARGEVGALIIAGVNPVFDLPDAATLSNDIKRVPLVVSTAERADETASLAHFVCPDHHYLEAWSDAEPVSGLVSLAQPTIRPMHETRAFIETLAAWAGKPQPALELIRAHWTMAVHPRAEGGLPFTVFWDRTLERGVAEVGPRPGAGAAPSFNAAAATPVLQPGGTSADGLTLVLYSKIGMLDGRHGHNAWLHEMPDPVTKVTWDNYASLSPETARRLGVEDGDVVRVTADGSSALELAAFVQPGQHDSVVSIALGYGRAGTDRFGRVGPPWFEARPRLEPVGVNAAVWITSTENARQYAGRAVTVTSAGRRRPLASTQVHHSLEPPGSTERRPIIQEVTLAELTAPPAAAPAEAEHPAGHVEGDLWPDDHPLEGHRWGMSIDLNSCTGCSACIVACQAENNVPVVGQDEVRRNREMHWLRIDRYYSGTDDELEVAHQPMLCQHCEHAPCETVCPVLATTHSEEGLNEQAYNRCVGTRYCANNCPYKVRRFNWFDYPHEDRLQNLVFNPNVVVRSRGVMEKCSFCVQRIQENKIEAKRLGQPLADGAIKTACEQTCPAQAIVFGDLHDPNSRVTALAASRRAYRVLEELNTQPSVRYLKLVRHERPAAAAGGEGRNG
ncbi:MAG TPA: 4Fe-4S dicluster domain-containing protein [Vicinamibacterales bacterium]|nr:4Fe-4S dicluster domain-containing protein [Vicinamibacterales bacterium]